MRRYSIQPRFYLFLMAVMLVVFGAGVAVGVAVAVGADVAVVVGSTTMPSSRRR